MLELTWQRFQLLDPYEYRGESRSYKESSFLNFNFKGHQFISELSVFPGLHDTNRESYQDQLPHHLLENLDLPKWALKNSAEVKAWVHQYYSPGLSPNTLQALDALMLDILGLHQKLPESWQKVYHQKSWSCPCAELITQLGYALHSKDLEGIYKIKMGRSDLEQESEWLKVWLAQNPKAKVRLDANQMWSADDLKNFLAQLSSSEKEAIDYLEDPCPPEQYSKLTFDKMPELALENLHDSQNPAQVWVYRPSSNKGLILGLCELEQHLQESAQQEVVLSSSFETPLGLSWCLFMANVLKLKRPQGLGTLAHLQETTPSPQNFPFEHKAGKLTIFRA